MDIAYIYDLVFAAITIISAVMGAKRGFMRMILSAGIYIAAFFLSGFISENFSEPVYMELFHDKIIFSAEEKLKERLNSIIGGYADDLLPGKKTGSETISAASAADIVSDSGLADLLNKEIESYISRLADSLSDKLPSLLCSELKKYRCDTGLAELLLADDMHGAAEYIELNVLRPPLVRLVRYVLRSVSFAAVAALGKVLSVILRTLRKDETVRSFDTVAGAVCGLISAAAAAAVSVFVIKLISGFLPGRIYFFSEEFISRTLLYKYIYYFFD